ncbi:MAG TPA: type IV-A pilus assembly ATPase PilB [Myxococcota bacterium]|nr:type IV-A pilus assembly ATPase PilB [Myxococcota bacterium]HON25663.1 type IV-A pilus assembly ATPase PilB [Myxococcota bacterium]HOS62482.1 type IV-A pilus assembly ATPase PilB [Myxococcota bacterium]HPC92558.1 type IV-A pilus assembly ATPase PilB [Myxococcota bacterium]HPL25092.1 type IV-A pilus assembly ATPase PilB [Myxococcota bacterium]
MPNDPNKPQDNARSTGSTDFLPARPERSSSVGDILLREKLVNVKQLEEAERVRASGENVTHTLAKLGYLEESQLINFLSRQYGVPSINLDEMEISDDVIKLVTKDVAQRHKLVPIARQGATLIVAMSDPGNIYAMDDIKFLTGLNVEVVVASETSIIAALERYYGKTDYDDALRTVFSEIAEMDGGTAEYIDEEDEEDLDHLREATEEAPVVRLVNMILVDAVNRQASDIHIEAYEKDFRVRYRMDGVLYEIMKPPLKLRNAITSRLKIMAQLDIAERRLPQDGRIRIVMGRQKEVDFRVSVLPCLFGEKVVLRILDKSALNLDLGVIGFEERPLKYFREAIHQPWGMVLVTGPTGSGKTTTLYSALSELNTPKDNISTAEDPVEMNIPGVNQVHVREEIGLSFAAALRSFLRQDPDIIMVGEIRDFETAETAVKAALTGHLVLSTLHTNDAPSTVNRLLNMGVEPFLLTATLNLIAAQRLVRRICKECREPIEVPTKTLLELGFTEEEASTVVPMKGKGCRVCNDTGYKGRTGLYEIMPIFDELKEYILQGYSALELKREAVRLGMMTLRMAGLAKVKAGATTIDEVVRVTRAD